MHRDDLIQKLETYQPADPLEQQYKIQILEFIRRNSACFERTLEEGHITGSAWLLNCKGTKALLMHHAKLNIWVQPGGHCDGDSDVLRVAIREAKEESGIQQIAAVNGAIFDIDIHSFPKRNGFPKHWHFDIRFLLQAVENDEIIQSKESKALCWIEKDARELPTKSESVVRMFRKWVHAS